MMLVPHGVSIVHAAEASMSSPRPCGHHQHSTLRHTGLEPAAVLSSLSHALSVLPSTSFWNPGSVGHPAVPNTLTLQLCHCPDGATAGSEKLGSGLVASSEPVLCRFPGPLCTLVLPLPVLSTLRLVISQAPAYCSLSSIATTFWNIPADT